MAQGSGRLEPRYLVRGIGVTYKKEGRFAFRGKAEGGGGTVVEVGRTGLQFVAGAALQVGDKLDLTIAVGAEEKYLQLKCEVRWATKTADKEAYNVGVKFVKPAKAHKAKLEELISSVESKQEESESGDVGRRSNGPDSHGNNRLGGRAARKSVPGAKDGGEAEEPADRQRRLARSGSVQRPVALLKLIDELESFEVTDQLVRAVIESAESGLTIESLFATEVAVEARETETVEEEMMEAPPPPTAEPIAVYRLGGGARLHWGDKDMPVGPPTGHIYVSRLADEKCFACEVADDSMTSEQGEPTFKMRDIVLFSTSARVEDGDLAYVKTRDKDEFAQIFFEDDEMVRFRPLNGRYKERAVNRFEIRNMCKLRGRFQAF